MWEDILKRGKNARKTGRIIYQSAKRLIDEFIKDKDSFDRDYPMEYIKNNLLQQVVKDGELVKVINERHVPRRVRDYIRTIDTQQQSFHTYIKNQGYSYQRNRSGGIEDGTFQIISKAKMPAVKTEKYNLYVVFIKKILKKEGGAAGMKNFLEEGKKVENFDEQFLNYVIDDAIDHSDWLAEHEFGDFYLKE
jgi:hypothetical protein